jgi:hypothetical protein
VVIGHAQLMAVHDAGVMQPVWPLRQGANW